MLLAVTRSQGLSWGGIEGFHRGIDDGSTVFTLGNVHALGVGGELIAPLDSEDTLKIRRPFDGSEHRIVRNYYDEPALRRVLCPSAHGLRIHMGHCLWWVAYST